MSRFLLVVAAIVGLAACDAADPSVAPADAQSGEVALALGASASLDGFSLTFSDVVEDSRCPEDVACFWAGVAIVEVTIDGQSYALTVVDPEREPDAGIRLDGALLFAVRLTPEPTADRPSPTERVVTLVTFETD